MKGLASPTVFTLPSEAFGLPILILVRMGELIEMPISTDVVYEIDNDNDVFMMTSRQNKLAIGFEDGKAVVRFGNVSVVYSRSHLAKMLWSAAYLVDSHEVWKGEEYPARNYPDGVCKKCAGQLLPTDEMKDSCHAECLDYKEG